MHTRWLPSGAAQRPALTKGATRRSSRKVWWRSPRLTTVAPLHLAQKNRLTHGHHLAHQNQGPLDFGVTRNAHARHDPASAQQCDGPTWKEMVDLLLCGSLAIRRRSLCSARVAIGDGSDEPNMRTSWHGNMFKEQSTLEPHRCKGRSPPRADAPQDKFVETCKTDPKLNQRGPHFSWQY